MTDAAPIAEAVAGVLRAGGLVAFPTETVYGLGADAANADAVRRLFAVKGRPADHPLIVHLATADALDAYAESVTDAARALANACWPGPLTLVVRLRDGVIASEVTGGRATVALRVPAHPVAHALLREFGGGVAAPSANRFGRVSPTTAAHVHSDLGSDVDLVLDGGPTTIGVESTIVDCSGVEPAILRLGGVDARSDRSDRRSPGRAPHRQEKWPRPAPSNATTRRRPRWSSSRRAVARATWIPGGGDALGLLTDRTADRVCRPNLKCWIARPTMGRDYARAFMRGLA